MNPGKKNKKKQKFLMPTLIIIRNVFTVDYFLIQIFFHSPVEKKPLSENSIWNVSWDSLCLQTAWIWYRCNVSLSSSHYLMTFRV